MIDADCPHDSPTVRQFFVNGKPRTVCVLCENDAARLLSLFRAITSNTMEGLTSRACVLQGPAGLLFEVVVSARMVR
ncbi:MAG: hypothetical protein QM723_07090 [Myxococcaceae bacterium]